MAVMIILVTMAGVIAVVLCLAAGAQLGDEKQDGKDQDRYSNWMYVSRFA